MRIVSQTSNAALQLLFVLPINAFSALQILTVIQSHWLLSSTVYTWLQSQLWMSPINSNLHGWTLQTMRCRFRLHFVFLQTLFLVASLVLSTIVLLIFITISTAIFDIHFKLQKTKRKRKRLILTKYQAFFFYGFIPKSRKKLPKPFNAIILAKNLSEVTEIADFTLWSEWDPIQKLVNNI